MKNSKQKWLRRKQLCNERCAWKHFAEQATFRPKCALLAVQVFYVGPKWRGGLWKISSSRKRHHRENGLTTKAVMTVQKLEKADWSPFFNHLSKTLAGSQVEIDVGSLALGGQVQANWVALIGLVYDPKDDLVEVALEGLDHLIHNPRDIYIEQGNGLVGEY